MRHIVCISDTHGLHDQVTVPAGDVLVHCGDTVGVNSLTEITGFLEWFENQPHPVKLYCAGNHDGIYERFPKEARKMVARYAPSVRYLEEESIEVGGFKWFFSPYTPTFFDWYFMADRGSQINSKWEKIPKETQVLITHGPPYGVLDLVPSDYVNGNQDRHQGCSDLRATIDSRLSALKLHVFGHLHSQGGEMININGVIYVNAAICDERYKPTRQPRIISLDD